ncbi:MAG TPA: hypothetical protein VKE22_21120 [Haliangiales bacterium]|nr:hypothetical protein [Haliangiales bacterium]
MLPWIALPACVVPIPAEVEAPDGGIDHSPFVKSSTPPMPGNTDLPAMVSLTLEDADISDTLYLRVFRDYDQAPLGPLTDVAVTNNPLTGTIERTTILPTNTWCNGASVGSHMFLVVVADEPFNPDASVKPEYQAVTNGGKFTRAVWIFRCAVI